MTSDNVAGFAVLSSFATAKNETVDILAMSPSPLAPGMPGMLLVRNGLASWQFIPYGAPNDKTTRSTSAESLFPDVDTARMTLAPIIELLAGLQSVEYEIREDFGISTVEVSVKDYIDMAWGSNQATPPQGVLERAFLVAEAHDEDDGWGDSVLYMAENMDETAQMILDASKDRTLNQVVLLHIVSNYVAGHSQDFFDSTSDIVNDIGRLGDIAQAKPTTKVAPPVKEYTRPNGETYYSRVWSGMEDVEVLRLARENEQFPLLYGPPGTGKNALVEAAFGEDLITVVLSGDTEVSDLVGQFIPNPKHGEPGESEYVWTDGPLIRAAEGGLPFLLDEVGLGDPKVLSVVYSLMDGRRELTVTMNPDRGTVKSKPGFFVLGATNPNAPGTQLSEALLSRFNLHVEVQTDWRLAITKLKVPEKITALAQSLAKSQASGESTWAPQMRELLTFKKLVEVYDESFALANLIASCPEGDRPLVQERVRRVYGEGAFAARIGPSQG